MSKAKFNQVLMTKTWSFGNDVEFSGMCDGVMLYCVADKQSHKKQCYLMSDIKVKSFWTSNTIEIEDEDL